MSEHDEEMPIDAARQRLRFSVTGGDVELMASSGGGGRTGRESAGSVASDVKRFLVGKGLKRLDEERLTLILRSANWRPYLRLDLSNTGLSQLVFGEPKSEEASFWLLSPDKSRGWRTALVGIDGLPPATGADLLFRAAAERLAADSASSVDARRLAVDLATKWWAVNVPMEERALWAAVAESPEVVTEWTAAGFSSPGAREWLRSRFSIGEATLWAKVRIGPKTARLWTSAGYGPQGAKPWHDRNIGPSAAASFIAAGIGVDGAANWVKALGDAETAARWLSNGFTLEQAAAWKSLTPEKCAAVVNGVESLTPSEVLLIQLAGHVPPERLGIDTHPVTPASDSLFEDGAAPATTESDLLDVSSGDDSPEDGRDPTGNSAHPSNEQPELNVDIEESVTQLDALRGEHAELASRYAEVVSERDALLERLYPLQAIGAELAQARAERDESRSELLAMHQRLSDLEIRLDEAGADRVAARVAGAAAESELADLTVTLGHREAELAQAMSTVDRLSAEAHVAQAELRAAHDRIADLSGKLIGSYESIESVRREASEEVAALTMQLERWRAAVPKRIVRRIGLE